MEFTLTPEERITFEENRTLDKLFDNLGMGFDKHRRRLSKSSVKFSIDAK